jgi:hypothetical protein
MREAFRLGVLMLVLAGGISCQSDQPTAPTGESVAGPQLSLVPGTHNEEELIGNFYSNGSMLTSGTFTVLLEPLDTATANRVWFADASTMTINLATYTANRHYGWSDAAASDGPCAKVGATDPAERIAFFKPTDYRTLVSAYYEMHTSTGQRENTLVENHCIRPGRYQLSVSGAGNQSLPVDYLAVESSAYGVVVAVSQTHEASETYTIESDSYLASDGWVDLVVDFDFGSPSGTRPTPAFHVDAVSVANRSSTFSDAGSPVSGSSSDVFRFSLSDGASNAGVYHSQLARLYWDYNLDRTDRSGFWSPEEVDIRTRSYAAYPGLPRCIRVGAELMFPNNTVTDAADTYRDLSIGGSSCASGADLIPISVVPQSSTVAAGGTLGVAIGYGNAGSVATANASTAKVYLSTSPTCCSGASLLATQSISSGLAVATPQSATPSGTVPSTPGTYYVHLVMNEGTTTAERETANNKLVASGTVAVTAPDFVIDSVKGPSSYTAGGTGTVPVYIRNIGNGSGVPSTIGVYLSADNTYDGSDVIIGSLNDGTALGAGGSRTENVSVTIPSAQASGSYYIIARVDASSAVAESNEGNNTGVRSGQVTITAAPDLVPGLVKLFEDSTVTGVFDTLVGPAVSNAGGATAGSGWVVYSYLSTDSILDGGDMFAGSRTVSSTLAAGATITTSNMRIGATTPCVDSGFYYVIVKLDATNVIAEANEANNVAFNGLVYVESAGPPGCPW